MIRRLAARLAVASVCLIGLSREGHVGQVSYEDVPLKTVVSASTNIVEAEFKVGKLEYYGYKVKSVLKGKEIKAGETIRVVSHGTALLKTMDEGKSPIMSSYPIKDADGDPAKTKMVMLFLDAKAKDGTYEFSVWPGYTGVTELPAIQALLATK